MTIAWLNKRYICLPRFDHFVPNLHVYLCLEIYEDVYFYIHVWRDLVFYRDEIRDVCWQDCIDGYCVYEGLFLTKKGVLNTNSIGSTRSGGENIC